jgi:broad-specificity NMP kinase
VQDTWRSAFERQREWATQGVTDEVLCEAIESHRATAGVHFTTQRLRAVLKNQMNKPQEAASWSKSTVAVMEGLRAVLDAMHNEVRH